MSTTVHDHQQPAGFIFDCTPLAPRAKDNSYCEKYQRCNNPNARMSTFGRYPTGCGSAPS